MKRILALIYLIILSAAVMAQQRTGVQIARLKYSGGGDWYNDPSAEVNLLNYIKTNTTIKVIPRYVYVDIASDDMFQYPILFMTGHGSIKFSEEEAKRLRKYLEAGGFLYADDDYGMDKFFRREIKKVFPEKELKELPFSYGLYHIVYDFKYGPPKIHKHNGKRPQGFGIFIGKRLAVYYTYESNPSDGWVDPEVHHDPPEIRKLALQFGVNLISWILTQ